MKICRKGLHQYRFIRGISRGCIRCKRDNAKARHKASPEKNRARVAAWNESNPGKSAARSKAWQQANPEKSKAWHESNKRRAKGKRLRRYWPELTWQEALDKYEEFLKYQDGVCAICKNPETKIDTRVGRVKDLSVDHDHTTLKVRGLLCSKHNAAIGLLGDTVEGVQAALKYLKSPPNLS